MSIEKVLSTSPMKIKEFFDNIPIPVYIWQKRKNDLYLINYNSAAYKESKGQFKNDLRINAAKFYKNNRDLLDDLKRCVNEHKSISKEIKYVCNAKKENKFLKIKIDFIYPDLVLVHTIDITKQKLLEQKLKESKEELANLKRSLNQELKTETKKLRKSEKKYRLISENANDMISILNHKYKYEYVNEKSHLNVLGYNSDDLIGKTAWKFIHPDDISNFITVIKDKERYDEIIVEFRARHKNGDWIWIQSKGSIFKAENNEEKILLVSRDITTRKKAEEKLKEPEIKYREAYNRANFYKNLFVHDISNIVNVIKSALELCLGLMDDPNKSGALKEYLSMIREQIIRGNKLIKNVHRLSEIEETKQIKKSMELCKVLKEAVNYIYKSYKRKKIEIDFKSQSKKIFVQANNLLLEVFENILINAIKYAYKPIVKISVKISEIEKDNRNYIKLEFIDNGIGITDTRKKLIFQEGYKRENYTKGMGFGLTLVKKIINSYNGQIWVQDRVQGDYTKGANFVILIPIR